MQVGPTNGDDEVMDGFCRVRKSLVPNRGVAIGVNVIVVGVFFFSSRRRHTRLQGDWSSDVCSSDLISRHPFQFYFWLPLKRAHTMWFDTHSQYWPFEGTLMPPEDLDYGTHQQVWLQIGRASCRERV